MNIQDIKAFFDKLAPTWDSDMVDKTPIIERILNNAQVKAGQTVLDVACGTGVLFPFYLSRGVLSVTGIDLSEAMAEIAIDKFRHEPRVKVLCGDAQKTDFEQQFDSVMIYNAFPHFPKGERLIERLSDFVADNGRLTVAHSMSREQINRHHEGVASKVSRGLPEAQTLKEMLSKWFDVDVVLSTDEMYEVSGVKKSNR